MKLLIVSTALLALATAATLPAQNTRSQNEMVEDKNDWSSGGNYYETVHEHEERASIADSFDVVVDAIRQYRRHLTENLTGTTKNSDVSIPDVLNVGSVSDTLLTNIRVKGLNGIASQNVTMAWGVDVVNTESSWPSLSIDGLYYYTNTAGRYAGKFNIVLVEPRCTCNTSLTKNSNTYPAMSLANSFTFKKVLINYTKLPELFQNEKPQFGYFVKNVVSQYVAAAMAENMYNDGSMIIRQTVRPYLTYRNDKIADDATAFSGHLNNGNRFQLNNIQLVDIENTLAKIAFVQMNHTADKNAAEIQLRLMELRGQCDCVVSAEGNQYSGKVVFKFGPVMVVPTMNLGGDKTVYTQVFVKNARAALVLQQQDPDTINSTDVEEQLTKQLVKYFVQQIAKTTSQSIQDVL